MCSMLESYIDVLTTTITAKRGGGGGKFPGPRPRPWPKRFICFVHVACSASLECTTILKFTSSSTVFKAWCNLCMVGPR